MGCTWFYSFLHFLGNQTQKKLIYFFFFPFYHSFAIKRTLTDWWLCSWFALSLRLRLFFVWLASGRLNQTQNAGSDSWKICKSLLEASWGLHVSVKPLLLRNTETCALEIWDSLRIIVDKLDEVVFGSSTKTRAPFSFLCLCFYHVLKSRSWKCFEEENGCSL